MNSGAERRAEVGAERGAGAGVLAELHRRGAHFIAIDGAGKAPIGYGKCAEGCRKPPVNVASSASHLESCRGWKSSPLPLEQAQRRWADYERRRAESAEAYPTLGLIPSSLCVYAVDGDGVGKAPLTVEEERAMRLAWGFVLGRGLEAGYVEPVASQRTLSGGRHLLYAVRRLAKPLPKDSISKWMLLPNQPSSAQRGDPSLLEEGELLVMGDVRHADGYVAVYELEPFLRASQALDRVELPRPAGGIEGELRRYYYAARLATMGADSGRHVFMRDAIMQCVDSGALDDPHPFKVACELNGKVADSKGDTFGAIDSLWDGWLAHEDCGLQPDRRRWRGGFSKRQRQRAERRVVAGEQCVLGQLHEDYERRNAEAFRLLDGRMRAFEFGIHELKEDMVWDRMESSAMVRDRVQGLLSDASVCRRCLAGASGMVQSVCRRIEADGLNALSPLRVALLVDGVVHVLDTMDEARERLGVASISPWQRLRPAVADDLNLYRPTFDIGACDPRLLSQESAVEKVMRAHLDFGEADVWCFMRWMSRMDDEASKRVPLIMADAGSGKSTWAAVVKQPFASNGAVGYGGHGVEKYQMGVVQRATLVVVDEAQNLSREALGELKDRLGGAESDPREMYARSQPRASRMSALLLTERQVFDFGMHGAELMQAGWMEERLMPVIATRRRRMPGLQRRDLLDPLCAQHFAWRWLNVDPDHYNDDDERGTPRMCADRRYLQLMWQLLLQDRGAKKGPLEARLELTESGGLKDYDQEPSTWAPASLDSDRLGDNLYRHKADPTRFAQKMTDGTYVEVENPSALLRAHGAAQEEEEPDDLELPPMPPVPPLTQEEFEDEGEDLPWD